MRIPPRLITGALAALVAGGCTITTNDGTTPTGATGHLATHWTVVGTTDAAQCTANGAATARIFVLDSAGVKVNPDDTQSCSAFGATLTDTFAAGTYTVQTTLLAADGTPVTTTSSVLVTIPGDGTTAQVSTDFALASFVHPTTGTGKLEVYWTLEESTDPAECSIRSVASARVDVFDATGVKMNTGADTQVCTALGTSFTQSFAAGTYTVQLTLLGADGSPRTTTATATTSIPADGTTVRTTVDFPATSFF